MNKKTVFVGLSAKCKMFMFCVLVFLTHSLLYLHLSFVLCSCDKNSGLRFNCNQQDVREGEEWVDA
jgi:hypothetical protein